MERKKERKRGGRERGEGKEAEYEMKVRTIAKGVNRDLFVDLTWVSRGLQANLRALCVVFSPWIYSAARTVGLKAGFLPRMTEGGEVGGTERQSSGGRKIRR